MKPLGLTGNPRTPGPVMRKVVVIAGLAVVLVLSAVGLGLAGGADDPPLPMPTAPPAPTGPSASEKAEAAIADKEAEVQRVEDADAAFKESLDSTPDATKPFLVSLEAPAPLAVVLSLPGSIQAVDTWIHLPGSLYPKTGHWQMSTFTELKDDFEAIEASITSQTESYLESRIAAIEQAALEGSIEASAAESQVAEEKQLLVLVQQSGLQVYGFTCVCTAVEVASLTETTELSAHAIEDLIDSPGSQAIWPANPLRDLLMQGG